MSSELLASSAFNFDDVGEGKEGTDVCFQKGYFISQTPEHGNVLASLTNRGRTDVILFAFCGG